MKISLFLLCLYIFNVQGLPTHGALPDGYVSYSPQDFVAYLKKLSTIQQHWFELGNRATFSNLICYQEFTASLQDLAIKTQIGNLKCTKILNDATNKADIDLEENRKLLHLEAERINLSLGSCYNIELASTALECYETKGQQNVNPVSSLSSQSRTYKRNYDNTINFAKYESDGCSYDVSTESETISAQIFTNLNNCIDSGFWEPIYIYQSLDLMFQKFSLEKK